MAPIDTTETGETGQKIETVVDQVEFFDLPAKLPDKRQISDPLWHSLEADDGDCHHAIEWTDRAEPPDGLAQIIRVMLETGVAWRDD